MATVSIFGTITDATGAPVECALLRLSPAPQSEQSAAAIGGIGIVLDPVEQITDANGDFAIDALVGFRYLLEIPSIGWSRTFTAPDTTSIRFDLLGLIPSIESAPNGVDEAGIVNVSLLIKADPIGTVLERYDVIVVERGDTAIGPFAEIVTLDLLPNREFYEYTDNPATADVFYRAFYKNTATLDVSPYGDIVSAAEEDSSSLVISVDELKELYLFGADLTGDDGSPFPRRMFEHYIQAGVAWLEKELDIPLTAVNITEETHDHYARDYSRWGYFQLRQYPVIRVDKVQFQYPSTQTPVTIEDKWIVLTEEGAHGVIQIVPGQGNIADVLLIPGALMPLWSGRSGRVPGIWRFDYRAGFENGELPKDLKHAIGMWASIGILNIAGDLIAGAGIATKSVSVPGLSQNIGTTSSATNSGYGARIGEYQKELKEMLPNLRRFYGKTTRMVVV